MNARRPTKKVSTVSAGVCTDERMCVNERICVRVYHARTCVNERMWVRVCIHFYIGKTKSCNMLARS